MMYVCMCVGVCDTEKNSVKSAPSFPLLWVLGFEHKSPGLHGERFYSLSHSPGCTDFSQNARSLVLDIRADVGLLPS